MARLIVGIAAAILLAAPAASFERPISAAVEEKAPERLICKTSNQLGSRLRKSKSCRTAKEWADITAQTQEKTRDYQRVGWKPGAPDGK